MYKIAAITVLAFALTAALTGLTRRFARRLGLMDVPDVRSAHLQPTPRGGGLAIVVCFTILLIFLSVQDKVAPALSVALLGGGILVAGVGLVDDLREVAIVWRLAAHFAAVAWMLTWLDGFPGLQIGSAQVHASWVVDLCGAIFLVWLLNLYNFMDGIDGLAAIETLTVLIGAAFLLWQRDLQAPLLILLVCASVGGFLLWNWPPATIFLGDVGSGFLGFLMGGFLVATATELGLWPWLILLGVFLVDATWTLCRRMARRERWYQPHNTHVYQRAARRLGSHKPVTAVVGMVNLFWLLPIAWLAAEHQRLGFLLAIVACLPLFALTIWFELTEKKVVVNRD
jgi:Fuc2NAc and GlcNAc transferase